MAVQMDTSVVWDPLDNGNPPKASPGYNRLWKSIGASGLKPPPAKGLFREALSRKGSTSLNEILNISARFKRHIAGRRAHATQEYPAASNALAMVIGTSPNSQSQVIDESSKEPETTNIVRPYAPIQDTTMDGFSKATRQTREAMLNSVTGVGYACLPKCSPMPCRGGPSSHIGSNQTTGSASTKTDGEGQSSQDPLSVALSDARALSLASASCQLMEFDDGDDGNDENFRRPLKHSHDVSEDDSDTDGKRKRHCQTKQGREQAYTDKVPKISTDDAHREPSPFPRGIAAAATPNHLLNNSAFTDAPRYSSGSRSHTDAITFERDLCIRSIVRRPSGRDNGFQAIPQYDGAVDVFGPSGDIGMASLVAISPTVSEVMLGILFYPTLSQLGFASAQTNHFSTAPVMTESNFLTSTAQTDGPADADYTDNSICIAKAQIDGSIDDDYMDGRFCTATGSPIDSPADDDVIDDDLTDNSVAGEQLEVTRTWSWTKGDDKAPLSTNRSQQTFSPEERSGNADSRRSIVPDISLPLRQKSTVSVHPSARSSTGNSSRPTSYDSIGNSGASRHATSPTRSRSLNSPVLPQEFSGVPGAAHSSSRGQCGHNGGNQEAGPEASAQEAGPEVSVQEAGPEVSVQEATPEASVQQAAPKASVQEAPSVQEAAPEASVDEIAPEASTFTATGLMTGLPKWAGQADSWIPSIKITQPSSDGSQPEIDMVPTIDGHESATQEFSCAVSAVNGHESTVQEPTCDVPTANSGKSTIEERSGNAERIPSMSSNHSWGFVDRDRANWQVERGYSYDAARSREGSVSSTSTSGDCGCRSFFVDCLKCLSCLWGSRRISQHETLHSEGEGTALRPPPPTKQSATHQGGSEAPQAMSGPAIQDGPVAPPPRQPQASEMDIDGESSTTRNESQLPSHSWVRNQDPSKLVFFGEV